MPTFEEMINAFGGSPRTEPEDPARRTIWQQIKNEWPPLNAPLPPLTLEKIWQYILLDDSSPPSAEELAAEAAQEDRDYPECHNAMYRRSHPDWFEEKLSSCAEYYSLRRWQEIERHINGGSGLPPERSEWLLRHERLIRPLVQEAKAKHTRRYGEKPSWFRGIEERHRAWPRSTPVCSAAIPTGAALCGCRSTR